MFAGLTPAAIGLSLAVVLSSSLPGQRIEPSAMTNAPHGDARMAPQTVRPSRVPYVLGGAIVGGVVTAALTYASLHDSDAILGEVTGAIITAGGIVVGGLLGWAVYEVRY